MFYFFIEYVMSKLTDIALLLENEFTSSIEIFVNEIDNKS